MRRLFQRIFSAVFKRKWRVGAVSAGSLEKTPKPRTANTAVSMHCRRFLSVETAEHSTGGSHGHGTVARRLYGVASTDWSLSLIHISEPTRLGMTSYAVICLK